MESSRKSQGIFGKTIQTPVYILVILSCNKFRTFHVKDNTLQVKSLRKRQNTELARGFKIPEKILLLTNNFQF